MSTNPRIDSPFPRGSSPIEPAPPLTPTVSPEPEWRWSYSALVGIKYGPIPVGLFVAIPILIAMAAR